MESNFIYIVMNYAVDDGCVVLATTHPFRRLEDAQELYQRIVKETQEFARKEEWYEEIYDGAEDDKYYCVFEAGYRPHNRVEVTLIKTELK